MPIDPRVSLSYHPVQVESPLVPLAQAMRIRDMQEQSQINRLQMQEHQRRIDKERQDDLGRAKVNEIMKNHTNADGSFNWGTAQKALADEGFADQALALEGKRVASEKERAIAQKEQRLGEEAKARQAHTQTQTEKEQFELGQSRVKGLTSILAGVTDQNSMIRGVGMALDRGLIGHDLAEQLLNHPYDPEEIKQFSEQLLTAGERLTLQEKIAEAKRKAALAAPELKKAENEALTSTPNANGLTASQQSTADIAKANAARMDDQAKETKRHNEVTERETSTHNRKIEAKGEADKPSTGAEKRSLGFLIRAEAAMQDLDELKDWSMQQGTLSQGYNNMAPNVFLKSEAKRYNAAAKAFTEARLRKDSGAAIPEHEYAKDREIHFPVAGDDAKTLEEKARRRGVILDALKAESGRAYKEHYGEDPKFSQRQVSPEKSSGPKVGEIRNHRGANYRFDGNEWIRQN